MRPRFFPMGLGLLLLLSLMAYADETPHGYTFIRELGGIREYHLDSNGLTVLLMEDHSAPVLTFMVTYRVGSRNEVTGTTGATHLLEHLMFKGTPTFNKEKGTQIAAVLQNIGALMNATTWLDRTNYFENIPSDHLELVVQLEADRMRNSLLRKADLEAEMTVVRNEFERGENSPFSSLNKLIWATAFQAHPYHHSTIGWRSDIENVPIEKLREFYNTFYWPNNATVTVIGDFQEKEALGLIQKYFGAISASPEPIPEVYTTEPEQRGPRRGVVKRAGQLGAVGIGYKVPQGTHPDTYALVVLSKILNEGKTSRFYRALIDKNLAINTFAFYFPLRDPGLFISYAFLAPGASHEEVEKTILSEIERIRTEGVTPEEVTRAINQVAAETAYSRDGSFSIASELNEAIAMGDWTFYVTFPDHIGKVTPEDVQAVVKKYFVEDRSTTGYFIPLPPGGAAQADQDTRTGFVPEAFQYFRHPNYGYSVTHTGRPLPSTALTFGGARETEFSVAANSKRQTVEGIDLITVKTGVKDVITFTGSLAAGDVFSPEGNTMVADLTGQMLDKGTREHGKFALAEALENLGAEISFSVSTHTLDFRGKCLRKDLNTVIHLLAEQLRYPAFSEEELEKVKKQRIGSLKRLLENTNVRAQYALSQLIFPEGHPNHLPSLEQMIADVEKVTIEDIRRFHQKFYGPASMVLVAVGDLEHEAVRRAVQKSFKGWSGGVEYPEYPRASLINGGTKKVVKMEDKTSATLMIGHASTLKSTDPDYLPLMVGNYIFGGNFSARLMSIIRDDEGLTYGIRSSLSDDTFSDGQWSIQGTFAPQLLNRGLESTLRELHRWVEEGVTAQELQNKKTTLIGSFKVRLATTGGMANQILHFVQRGYDVDYLDQYPKDIEALTLEQVNAAIRRYIHPDQAVIVIAGSVDENGQPLGSH